MGCSSQARVAVLSGLYALLSNQVIRAQPDYFRTCPPSSGFVDKFQETHKKKVNPKIIVDQVKFDGPARLPDSSDERGVITELKQQVLNFGSDGLDEVLEISIRGAWQDQGFFKVIANGQIQIVSKDSSYEHAVVTIRVDPGMQYRLGDVRFRVLDEDEPIAFPREELRKIIPLQEGDIFSTEKIRKSLESLTKWYDSNGYIDYVATPETEVDENTLRISLVLGLQQGTQYHVGRIDVFGLKPSKAAVLTSTLKPGDVFNRSVLG